MKQFLIVVVLFAGISCGQSQPTPPTAAAVSPEDLQRTAVLAKIEEVITQDQVYAESMLKALASDGANSYTETVSKAKKSNEKLLELTAQIKSFNPSIKDDLRDQVIDFFDFEQKFNNVVSTMYIVSLGFAEVNKFTSMMKTQDFKEAYMSGAITNEQIKTKLK